MSDIQNTQAISGDTFEKLAGDLMDFVTSTIKAISELAAIDEPPVDALQTGLMIMAVMGREVAIKFAERGIVLDGGTVPSMAELVETGNDEETANYGEAKAYDVVA
jgi:hypothetical protein